MKSQIKAFAKSVLPQGIHHNLRHLIKNVPRTLERRETEQVFAAAPGTPSYLDLGALEALQKKYPFPPEYGWDPESLETRGKARSAELLRFPGAYQAKSFLELGCWDGMVSCCLTQNGKETTAIDYRDTGFDERASRLGVSLMQMNAADLQFEDESFDFIFSYDAFEHVGSPEDVLREAMRVVKKGGYIYLDFGPIYYSPFGEHAHESISVPYCQLLFTRNTINDFATQNGLQPIDCSHVNGWSLENYRELWNKYSQLKKVRYYESVDLSHLDVIRAYPSCFKSKSNYFENFIVDNIKVLFRKSVAPNVFAA